MTGELVRFQNLSVRFGDVEAVRDLSFSVAPGETAAIVGETGSGKSVAMLAMLGLLPPSAQVSGSACLEGCDLIGLPRRQLDRIRGKTVSIVFQEPQSALDPLFTIGSQVAAVLRFGRGLSRSEAWTRALALFDEVGIADPARRARAYPHELSGGQRQRVAIAMAIACEPKLLIADEPTTALDATVAARILDLLGKLKARHGMALILISHDLGLVRRIADSVHVMRGGALVESGAVADLVAYPRNAYTRRLLAAESIVPAPPATASEPILQARELTVRYPLRGARFGGRRWFTAVDAVSLDLARGQTLGLIGESGSGKSTLGRALLKLEPSSGTLRFEDRDLQSLSPQAMRPLRRDMQIVFQDPFSSLSPRLTVGDIVGEGLMIHEPNLAVAARTDRAETALRDVGLGRDFIHRLPHELSGGQRQRVAIARAIVLSPKLLVLDEPTSALDRLVQAEVLALLRGLQQQRGMSYLFITHDLRAVVSMAQQVAVMRDGRIVEMGPTEQVMTRPADPYTAALVDAAELPLLRDTPERGDAIPAP